MKKYLSFLLIFLFPVFLAAQVSQEEIGDFRLFYGKDSKQTIYSISYKGFKGEVGGTDGEFGCRVSPDYEYVEEKTSKGTLKYWRLGFTGRTSRPTGVTMNKGGKILIRLFDDSTITLLTENVRIKEDYANDRVWFLPSAKLTETNYNKIIKVGVKKIRFDTYPKVFDVTYDNDIIGEFLKEASRIIKEKLNDKSDRMIKGF